MHRDFRNCFARSEDRSEQITEARLFARAIQGKPLPLVLLAEAERRRAELEWLAGISTRHEAELNRQRAVESQQNHYRELLEFSAAISTDCEAKLARILREERELGKARERLETFRKLPAAVDRSWLNEAGWDSSKHPRGGFPQNRGWFSHTSGGQSAGSAATLHGSDRHFAIRPAMRPVQGRSTSGYQAGSAHNYSDPTTSQRTAKSTAFAKTAEYSPSHSAKAHLIADFSRGHHWVPRAVFDDLEDRMTENALRIFEMGTEGTHFYAHANDTWWPALNFCTRCYEGLG